MRLLRKGTLAMTREIFCIFEKMKLKIEITRLDYLNFNKYFFVKTRLKKTIITGFITILSLQIILNRTEFDLGVTIVSTIASIVVYFFAIYFSILSTESKPKDDSTILGLKEMEFNEDAVLCESSTVSSIVNWSTIKSLEEGRTAFYLFIESNSAFIIPKRYFNSTEQLNEFKNLIQSKIKVK